MTLTRRQFGRLSLTSLLLGTAASWPSFSLAENETGKPLRGLSAFGGLKYPTDFSHLDYVNVDAPKGGTLNFGVPNWSYNQNVQTFDTLNSFVLKGSAPPRMEICFDSLMVRAFDEPSAVYGLLAESVILSNDRNSFTFNLRKEARFHDGTALTADDVAFTYLLFKEDGHPDISLMLNNLDSAKVNGPHSVTLSFNGKQSAQAILAIVLLPILSKAFYDTNDFKKTTMKPALGSGPYQVGKLNAGSYIEYNRVSDYWAKDLAINKGHYNFDVLRIEFYRESQASFEAFKKGEITFREEFTSKRWATEYNFSAVTSGKAKQHLFDADKRASMQGTVCNMRRNKFSDPRTREAIGLCFDFEWTNANLFYNAYSRNQSYFQGSDFMAIGEPSKEQLALLEPLRDQLPKEVFGPALQQPISNGSGRDRAMLKRANELFIEAGWVRKGRQLVDANGRPFKIEFLLRSPSFERILGSFVTNLKLVGVDAGIRVVDPSQYQKRLEEFDFDLTVRALGYTATPTGEDIEQIFGSKYASISGSQNLSGLKSPAVDALISKMNDVTDRKQLTEVMRALDRVLRSTHSWIPNWHSANHRIAYWDMFGFPETKPEYAFPIEALWWVDKEKAKAIGKG
ncbi:MAG: extracellular solute-binding protein [Rhizobiaceae bacterium]